MKFTNAQVIATIVALVIIGILAGIGVVSGPEAITTVMAILGLLLGVAAMPPRNGGT